MPLTAAERAKKYRDSIKSDPEKHRKYLEKERTRYKKRKANGEYDTKNKSEREKRSLRKHWRNTKRKQREQKKNIQQGIDFMLNNSPVTSPERNENLHRQVLYCTVSEDTRHGPAAIWAQLHPVLEWIRSDMPHIDTIHFVSDGPTTQYRSKSNFFLHHSLIHGKYGFHKSTWNFTEAGHGKSSADGVGGLVKRTADDLVSKGTDIIDVNTFYTHVSERIRNVNFVVIPSDNIDAIHIPETLKPVKGTMSLHQVVSYKDKVDRIGTRTLSCF
ncbi:hypothetical protein FSP39_007878 [Pinctada imbricata]|uniref:Uncharacterized protein n=1 Tax=Pinctada imbricata TaxID=66713 RepID=A0AA88YE10_PINIB|nr:hypothetical protein FSP39_007878 [Pinctada imbricata]